MRSAAAGGGAQARRDADAHGVPPESPRADVLYFGSYDRGPGRNAILMEALRAAGLTIAEHHAEVWPDTNSKLAALTPSGAPTAARRQVGAWRELAREPMTGCSAIVVGATAHVDMPLARRLARRRAVPLVFDPLVSVAETVRDRRLAAAPLRHALRLLEARAFRLADRVLVDTPSHGAAWRHEMGVAEERLVVAPAGAPAAYRSVADYEPREGPLQVAYFGQFIPLHGLDTVLAAAELLRDEPVTFRLCGRGQKWADIRAAAERLRLVNVIFDARWRTPSELAAEVIAPADVCLGVFGAQPKAALVVPFKVYAGMASGRPVITGDTPAVRELLATGQEVTVTAVADPCALAEALRALARDPALRQHRASAARRAYDERFSARVLGRRVAASLQAAAAEASWRAARRGRVSAPRAPAWRHEEGR